MNTGNITLRRRQMLGLGLGLGFPLGLALAPALTGAAPVDMRIQRLGWAGIRVQSGNTSLYVDPLLNTKVWDDALREPLTPIEAAVGDRYVLVTHRHPDHFDPLAVKAALGEEGGVLISADAVGLLPAPPGARSRAVPLYEPQLLSEFTAAAVPAADGYGDPQVSWVISGGGRRILHCGDTLWHGHWWKIGRQYGPFDAVFMPVNGARFGWRKPVSDVPGVLTPEQAVAAAVVMGARLLVPIHYGVAPSDDYREVPNAIADLLEIGRRRRMGVEVLAPGQWVRWQAQNLA